MHLLEDIEARLGEMRYEASKREEDIVPPLLVMGTSERVGSNWFLDTIGSTMPTHNEPFRQQLNASHRLSPLNPDLATVDDLNGGNMHPYERKWLITFVTSKYGNPRQATKENSLFFAVKNYLRLFPHSPLVVLARNPIGIVSSFAKGNLYNKWQYEKRYIQVQKMAMRPEFEKYRFIVQPENVNDRQKLIRLMVLNTILLSEAIEGRPFERVDYEASIKDQRAIIERVSKHVFGDARLLENFREPQDTINPAVTDQTFITNKRKVVLAANLDKEESRAIAKEINDLIAGIGPSLTQPIAEKAKYLLTANGDDYSFNGNNSDPKLPRISAPENITTHLAPEFIKTENCNILCRKTLVTNAEFCEFLNKMNKAGLANIINGVHLFFNENMIHARGGRIHWSSEKNCYEISSGFENHPAYWMSWIGAYTFSLYCGARLPRRQEIADIADLSFIDFQNINADYRVGDVLPVCEKNKSSGEIHHLAGNLAVWCIDGPKVLNSQEPQSRYIYGSAWNTPSSRQQMEKIRYRPLTGSSRGVGIRLIKDLNLPSYPLSPQEIVSRFLNAFQILDQQKRSPMAHIDDLFIAALG